MNPIDTGLSDVCRQFQYYMRQSRLIARKKLPPYQFEVTEREGETPRQTLTRVREITDLVGATVEHCFDQIWVGAKDAETLNAARLAL